MSSKEGQAKQEKIEEKVLRPLLCDYRGVVAVVLEGNVKVLMVDEALCVFLCNNCHRHDQVTK